MSTKESDYAILSKIAYEARGGNRDFTKSLTKFGLQGTYTVEPSLSSDNYVTFTDTRTGKGVVAYRGTSWSNSKDLATDAAIFFGAEDYTKRFRDAVKVAKEASSFYGGNANVNVTGHSLGGSQAMEVTKQTGIESHSFNPGKGFERFKLTNLTGPIGSLIGGIQKVFQKKSQSNPSNTTVYTTGIDPISVGARRSSATFKYRKPGWDVHGIDNFIPKAKRRSDRLEKKRILCRNKAPV